MSQKKAKGMSLQKRVPISQQHKATQREEEAATTTVAAHKPKPAPAPETTAAPTPPTAPTYSTNLGETKATKTIRYSEELKPVTKRAILHLNMANIDSNIEFDDSMLIRYAVWKLAGELQDGLAPPEWMKHVKLK